MDPYNLIYVFYENIKMVSVINTNTPIINPAFNIPYLDLITLEVYNPVSGITASVQSVKKPADSGTNFKANLQEAENYDFLTTSNSAYFLDNHIDPRYKFNPQAITALSIYKLILVQNPDIQRSGVKPEINPPGFDLQTTRISGYEAGCQVVFGANPVTSASGPSRNLSQVPVKFFTNPRQLPFAEAGVTLAGQGLSNSIYCDATIDKFQYRKFGTAVTSNAPANSFPQVSNDKMNKVNASARNFTLPTLKSIWDLSTVPFGPEDDDSKNLSAVSLGAVTANNSQFINPNFFPPVFPGPQSEFLPTQNLYSQGSGLLGGVFGQRSDSKYIKNALNSNWKPNSGISNTAFFGPLETATINGSVVKNQQKITTDLQTQNIGLISDSIPETITAIANQLTSVLN